MSSPCKQLKCTLLHVWCFALPQPPGSSAACGRLHLSTSLLHYKQAARARDGRRDAHSATLNPSHGPASATQVLTSARWQSVQTGEPPDKRQKRAVARPGVPQPTRKSAFVVPNRPSPPERPPDKDGHFVFELGDNLTSRCECTAY